MGDLLTKKMLQKLQIASENADEILAYCCFHQDNKRPNLLISKAGDFAGYYKCWACGAFGKVEGLSKVNMKLKDKPIPINWNSLNKYYQHNLYYQGNLYKNHLWIPLAVYEWKLKPETLIRLGVGYNGEAYTFPVYNESLEIVGIQRVYLNGDKRLIKGSRIGIFISGDVDFTTHIIITEGIHDLATVLDLGFNGVGRLSCSCGNKVLKELVNGIDVTIISDNDKPGRKGAEKLATDLTKASYVGIMIPEQGKDISEMVELCGKETVKQYLRSIGA